MNAQMVDTVNCKALRRDVQPSMLTGRRIVPARDCTYAPRVSPNDLLDVDFDCRSIVEYAEFGFECGPLRIAVDGLYLIEILNDEGVDWRGCRLFERRPGGLWMDFSGTGDWRAISSLESYRMRIVGYVHQVFKPSL